MAYGSCSDEILPVTPVLLLTTVMRTWDIRCLSTAIRNNYALLRFFELLMEPVMRSVYSCVSNEPSGHDHKQLIFSLRLLRQHFCT